MLVSEVDKLSVIVGLIAASMVAEGARICGRVRFVWGVTSYLGLAWCDLELHGCYCMGACIKFSRIKFQDPIIEKRLTSLASSARVHVVEMGKVRNRAFQKEYLVKNLNIWNKFCNK